MKRILPVALAAGLSILACAAADKSYSANRYDARIEVREDGGLDVTETVDFRFRGGPFTYVYRDLALSGLDELRDIQAYYDGEPLSVGPGPGQFEIFSGDPRRVTWHFRDVRDATHEFTLRYRALGAIRADADADRLAWRVLPRKRSYRIAESTIELVFPRTTRLLGEPTAGRRAGAAQGDRARVFHLSGLRRERDIVLRAEFAPRTLAKAAPRWQQEQMARDQARRQGLASGLGVGLLLLAVGLFVLLRVRPSANPSLGATAAFDAGRPPGNTAPGVVAALLGAQPGVAAFGTLFDLARRGLLRIEQTKKSWAGREFRIWPADRMDGGLAPHEAELFGMLSRWPDPEAQGIKLTDLAQKLLGGGSAYYRSLRQEIRATGWLDDDRSRSRKSLLVAGAVLLACGVAMAVIGLTLGAARNADFGMLAGSVGVALAALGTASLIAGGTVSPRTAMGDDAARRWQQFAQHLKDVSKGRAAADSGDFERYLPYAIVFGLGAGWVKCFRRSGEVPLPEWFAAGADGVDALTAMIVSTNAAVHGGGDGGAGGGGGSGAG